MLLMFLTSCSAFPASPVSITETVEPPQPTEFKEGATQTPQVTQDQVTPNPELSTPKASETSCLKVEGELQAYEITWGDVRENPFGDGVIQGVIPWIDKEYRTLPERRFRAGWGIFPMVGSPASISISVTEIIISLKRNLSAIYCKQLGLLWNGISILACIIMPIGPLTRKNICCGTVQDGKICKY